MGGEVVGEGFREKHLAVDLAESPTPRARRTAGVRSLTRMSTDTPGR
jgi:hypothetical protein